METSGRPTWHYIWKCLYWWLLSICQISCLYQKVHNLPEILSYAAGLKWNIIKLRNISFGNEHWNPVRYDDRFEIFKATLLKCDDVTIEIKRLKSF